MQRAWRPLSRKYSAIVTPVYGAMNWSGADSLAPETTMVVNSIAPACVSLSMTAATVDRIFSHPDAVHFVSGALVRNVVDRAKTSAIKATVAGEPRGITTAHLTTAADQELAEARSVAAKNLGGY